MSDEMTPERLNHYRQHLHGTIDLDLLDHIAAIEAERDEATALLREVAETLPLNYEPGELTPYCGWCGGNMWLKHEADCVIERIRAWLAKQTGDQTDA